MEKYKATFFRAVVRQLPPEDRKFLKRRLVVTPQDSVKASTSSDAMKTVVDLIAALTLLITLANAAGKFLTYFAIIVGLRCTKVLCELMHRT